MYSKRRKTIIMVAAAFILFSIGAIIVYCMTVPDEITIFSDEVKEIHVKYPFGFKGDSSVTVMADKSEGKLLEKQVSITAGKKEEDKVYLTIFDKIRLKEIDVHVKERKKIYPGGQSVGVKMNVAGVVIVGMEEIPVNEEKSVNPCLNSGLQLGDIITEIDGVRVSNADQVRKIINNNAEGREIEIKASRNGKTVNAKSVPVLSYDENKYRLGLWVRDKTAGIGTLTYYDPEDGCYGALGHGIADPDTGILPEAADGEIINSKVMSVKQGMNGKPGEIRGIFYESDSPLGELNVNSEFGVFGSCYSEMKELSYGKLTEIGYQNEIKTGKAVILTTLDGEGVKEYEVEVEKVNRQLTPSSKSMVIKVTDPELLKKSGGIVQGMSGSPILQNGKIIGAVTHVFVNNPRKGYGVFIEWMLMESDKIDHVVDNKYTSYCINE